MINGIDNHAGHELFLREVDTEFYHLITQLKEIQKRGGVGIRIEKKEKDVDIFMFFESEDKDIQQEVVKLKKLLNLNNESDEFKLVYGRLPQSSNELTILSRSIMEILLKMRTYIDVPHKDLDEGRILPVLSSSIEKEFDIMPMIQKHSSLEKPNDAYLAVPYRDYWFWIDDRDPYSKNILTFLRILFSLAETSGPSQAPILTIPAS